MKSVLAKFEHGENVILTIIELQYVKIQQFYVKSTLADYEFQKYNFESFLESSI